MLLFMTELLYQGSSYHGNKTLVQFFDSNYPVDIKYRRVVMKAGKHQS